MALSYSVLKLAFFAILKHFMTELTIIHVDLSNIPSVIRLQHFYGKHSDNNCG